MILVIEGPDGAGKSTLARALSERLGWPLYTCPRTPKEGGFSVEESQAENRASVAMAISTGVDVILDRSFPSEYVYGTKYRNGGFDVNEVFALDDLVATSGGLGVLLRFQDPLHALGRMDHHVAEVGDIQELQELYGDYLTFSKMEWVLLNAEDELAPNIQRVMRAVRDERPSKDELFMDIARTVAARSTCLSRRVGAVLVSESGHVIATGYNGAPRGCAHLDVCWRLAMGTPSGADLDSCNDVHAEENCIAQAASLGVSTEKSTIYTTWSPCPRCARMLINAGVERVMYDNAYEGSEDLDMLPMIVGEM